MDYTWLQLVMSFPYSDVAVSITTGQYFHDVFYTEVQNLLALVVL